MAEQTLELNGIVSRLERVERENRVLKRGGGVVAMLLVAMVFIMGQTKSDRTIEADTIKAGTIFANLISLSNGDGSVLLMPGLMTVRSGSLTQTKQDVVYISTSEGPSVRVSDKDGFEASVGVMGLVTTKTGEQHKTSAASVVLFGKDKTVLWSAP